MRLNNLLLTPVILVSLFGFFSKPALANTDSVDNVQVNFQAPGGTITDTSPIITWTLPDNMNNVVGFTVRIRSSSITDDNRDSFLTCSGNTVITEHSFYKSGFNPPGGRPQLCGIGETSDYTNEVPTEYVIPPGILNDKYGNSGTVWFRVYVIRYENGSYTFPRTPAYSFTFNPVSTPLSYNPFGIGVYQYYSYKDNSNNDWRNHLSWAQNLVGQGGYVKLFFPYVGANPPIDRYNQVLSEVYKKGLTPVVRIEGDWYTRAGNHDDPGCWIKPSGTYDQYGQVVADFLNQLTPPPDGKPLYIEFWNEPNYGDIEWCNSNGSPNEGVEPVEFARYYLAAHFAVDRLGKPYIKMMPGALGRAGYRDYLKAEMQAMKDIVHDNLPSYIKYWAVHVYPNQNVQQFIQPTDTTDRYGNILTFAFSPFSYKDQLSIMSHYAPIEDTQVFVTEGGFCYPSQPQYNCLPNSEAAYTIFERNLIENLVKDPKVQAIMPHDLDNSSDPARFQNTILDTYAWVNDSSGTDSNGLPTNPRIIYTDVRNMIKDYHPGESVSLVGYAIASSPTDLPVSAQSTRVTQTSNSQITLNYTLPNSTTRTTNTIFARFFYSNGKYRDTQQSIIYNPAVIPSPSVTPVQTSQPTDIPIQEAPASNGRVSCAEGGSANFSWSPASKQGVSVTDYTIRINKDPATDWSPNSGSGDIANQTGNVTSTSVQLTAGNYPDWTVQASYSDGSQGSQTHFAGFNCADKKVVTFVGYAAASSPTQLSTNYQSDGVIKASGNQINLNYTLPDATSKTTDTIFVRFFYSNGQTKDYQQSVIYNPVVDNIRPRGYEVYPDSPAAACQITKTAQSGTNANISGSITGWACDPDDPSAQIGVDFHVDGQYAGTVTANSSLFNGPDLSGICGGTLNHGYTFNLSSSTVNLADGQSHVVTAFGHNVDSNGTEISGPDQGAHKWDYNAQLKAISNGATQSSNQFSVTCGGASGSTQTPITTDTIQTSGSWSGSVPHEVGQYGRDNLSASGGKTFQFNYSGSAHIYAVAINSSGNWDGGSVEKNTNISIPSGDYLQLITDTQNQSWSNLSLVQIQ